MARLIAHSHRLLTQYICIYTVLGVCGKVRKGENDCSENLY